MCCLQGTPTNKIEQHYPKKTTSEYDNTHTHEYQQIRENLTYSQAVKANTQLEKLTNVLNRTISEFLDRFENMTNRLMNQHKTIINLLTALIKILKISIDNIVRIALRNEILEKMTQD